LTDSNNSLNLSEPVTCICIGLLFSPCSITHCSIGSLWIIPYEFGLTFGRSGKIKLTKHARHKFELLRKYGFNVSEITLEEAITNPNRMDRRDDQLLALKVTDQEYALRAVYRAVNDNIVAVAFHPVKRERFNV